MTVTHLAIDIMGGDAPIELRVAAVIKALAVFPKLHVSLVGNQQQSTEIFHKLCGVNQFKTLTSRIDFVHCEQQVYMNDEPLKVLRSKPNSSMAVALKLTAENKADICLSSGNTGALTVMVSHYIKKNSSLKRPALSKRIPSRYGHTWLLDIGARINYTAEELLDLAYSAECYVRKIEKKTSLKIGLLNIGKESSKGTDVIKEANVLFTNQDEFNYHGYAEGNDLLRGKFDIIVCDGFHGNLALKTMEGTSMHLYQRFKTALPQTPIKRILAKWLFKNMSEVLHQFDPNEYNGAIFLGVEKPVVKSHGMAGVEAFFAAIRFSIISVS